MLGAADEAGAQATIRVGGAGIADPQGEVVLAVSVPEADVEAAFRGRPIALAPLGRRRVEAEPDTIRPQEGRLREELKLARRFADDDTRRLDMRGERRPGRSQEEQSNEEHQHDDGNASCLTRR
jgi:hypothetical protein